MKRTVSFVTFVVLIVSAASLLLAQGDLFVGTWKLNLAKSKYGTAQAPKSQTRTVEPQGEGVKITMEGVAADGSRIEYSYTTNYDGKESPISGAGQANGADTFAVKRVDANTYTTTGTKAGKVVTRNKTVVSKDGKVMTITSKGVDANGKPRNVVNVWDKQ